MKLQEKHQKIFDEVYPDGYVIKTITMPNGTVIDESDYFHIMYVDVIKDGEWARGVPVFQKYSVKDWQNTLAILNKHQIKAVTGHSEYSVIHDPTAKAREAKAKPEKAEVKPGVKAKGRPPQKQFAK